MTISDAPTQTLPTEGEVGFVDIGSLTTESGAVIDDVCIAIQRWGQLSPARDNVVVVLHALTGDSHITGPAGPGHPTAGWWDGVAGPGAPIDTDRWCVVATNVLGGCRGSTGPGSLARDGKPWGSRFPLITVRDQVEADITALAEECRFGDCGHQVELGCAVRAALESGALDASRWESYRKLRAEVAWRARQTDVQAAQATKKKWKAVHKAMRVDWKRERRE